MSCESETWVASLPFFTVLFHNQRRNNGASYNNYHNGSIDVMTQYNHHQRSAFSDPVVMEQLCGVLAANAMASVPRHLVSDWILPSIDTLPTFAVVAVMYNIAAEAMWASSPVGTKDNVMQSLVSSVFERALSLIMVDSLRECDDGQGGTNDNTEYSVAAVALRSFEVWCKLNSIRAIQLQEIFSISTENVSEVSL